MSSKKRFAIGLCHRCTNPIDGSNKAWCKACTNAHMKDYRALRKLTGTKTYHDKRTWKMRRNERLKSNFGITEEEFDTIYNHQQGKCIICLRHEDELKCRLGVDHCHETGQIRGLLCRQCNSGIGFLKDSVDFLERAIKHLKGIK